jgi:hypothetical protein
MRPRFKLRTLLIAVTACACALVGWRLYMEPYRQARIARAELESLGAFVKFEPVSFPRWLRWLPYTTGCFKITEVSSYPQSDHYPGYSEYDLRNRNLDDRVLEACSRVNTIKSICLPDTKITDNGLRYLRGQRDLVCLSLEDTSISDNGVAHLSGLTNLSFVWKRPEKAKVDNEPEAAP